MQRKLLILSCLYLMFFIFTGNQPAAQARDMPGRSDTAADYKKSGAPMPPLRLAVPEWTTGKPTAKIQDQSTVHKMITEADLAGNANLLVMMFNPTCGHCEDQTKLFTLHSSLFQKSRLVLMAGPMMLPYLEAFNRGLHIDAFSAAILGVDSSGFIEKTFLYETLPQINIYDHERKLIRSFTGLVPIDSLKQFIE